jgi:dihydrofolate reductase
MGKVTAGFSMSLDGFVADEDDGVDRVFKWYSVGDTTADIETGDGTFTMSEEGAESIREGGRAAGVLVSARRTFEIAGAWGGRHPMDVPVVIVTHSPPQEWVDKKGSPFTFVTDGVPSAIAKAQDIAGDKDGDRRSERHPGVPEARPAGRDSHRPRAAPPRQGRQTLRPDRCADRTRREVCLWEAVRHALDLSRHQVAQARLPHLSVSRLGSGRCDVQPTPNCESGSVAGRVAGRAGRRR